MHLLDRSMNVASTYKTPTKTSPPDIWEKLLKLVRICNIESLKLKWKELQNRENMSDCVFDLALIIKLLKAFTNYYYFHENL